MVPFFNWRKCRDRPLTIGVDGHPVAINEKVYVRGWNKGIETVLEYTPGDDMWVRLPPPPVNDFTVATLRGKLLVMGGVNIHVSTRRTNNTILTFNEHSRQWVQSHPAMPTAPASPAVIGYQDHLIVAGGYNSAGNEIHYVNILDTTSNNKWKTARPLPSTDDYYTVLIEDTLYLVGRDTQTVLRAHVPLATPS